MEDLLRIVEIEACKAGRVSGADYIAVKDLFLPEKPLPADMSDRCPFSGFLPDSQTRERDAE